MTARTNPQTSEAGFAAVELAVLVPVLVVMIMLLQLGWSTTTSRSDVRFAAAQGARAAAQAQTPDGAQTRAREAVADVLADRQVPCRAPAQVDVDVTDFRIDGYVAVTVHCNADLSRLSLLRVPGTVTSTSTAGAVIDRLRGGNS